jgi:hypothetical protein
MQAFVVSAGFHLAIGNFHSSTKNSLKAEFVVLLFGPYLELKNALWHLLEFKGAL